MDYVVNEIFHDGEAIEIIFDFVPPNGTLTCFLVSDFLNFQDCCLLAIDKVLQGESEKEEVTGNDTYVEFGPETTFLENMFPPDENVPETCTVDTKELRQVMDEWIARHAQFETEKEQRKRGAANGKGESR